MNNCIDVYAAPTIDHAADNIERGGPAFYILFAMHGVGASIGVNLALPCSNTAASEYLAEPCRPTNFEAYRDCATAFSLELDPQGVKRLKALHSTFFSDALPSCNAAVFSPINWEYSPMLLAKYSAGYRVCILDVQGFTRISSDGRIERFGHLLAELRGHIPWNCIVRISVEDVGDEGLEALSYIVDVLAPIRLVVTFGEKGAIALDRAAGIAVAVEPYVSEGYSVGAGDMFTGILAYMLLRGEDLAGATIAAASAVKCLLDSREGTCIEKGVCSKNLVEIKVRKVKRLPCTCHNFNSIISLLEWWY
ncbi:hypothetical protein Hbut_1255 [Hyperthermus butylicus DSM 5456]|uniref:Carbohydrate kinase PfkB domain-containing protein n=2 Tax=Hyperthermus butylicus TaxID=54248 RepID=A2BM76_HYPBU|nr:hypothetical protein Hbut_1255 [Hyperthermus butylicus DSM 5456]